MLGACIWRPSEITRCYPTALVLLDNDLPPACSWTETKETPALISVISLGHSAQFEFLVNMPNSSDDANSPSQPSWRSRSWAKSWLKVKGLVVQFYLTLCNSMDCSPWNFPSENTGVGCHFLLLGIFPTQVSCTASRFFTFWATRDWESQSEELTLSLGKTEHKQREHASKHVQNTGRFTLQEASSHIILMANPVLDTPNLHTRKQRHKETQKSLCTLSPCDTN